MVAGWKTFDSGLFSVEVPTDWVTEEQASGTLLIRDAANEMALTLSAVSKPESTGSGGGLALGAGGTGRSGRVNAPRLITPKEVQFELQQWIGRQKQVSVRQVPRLVSGTFHLTCTTEGLERLNAGVSWWRRVLHRGPLMLWRFWAVLNPHLLVLASCNGPPNAMEQQRQKIDRVIMSIHLTNRDLLVGRHFTEAVASLARGYFPLTSVAMIDDGHLRFGSCAVDLGGLHRRYLESPDELSSHVRKFFADVQRQSEGSVDVQEWSRVREQVMPALVEAGLLAKYGANCVHQDWINGLHIVYVLDPGGEEGTGGTSYSGKRGVTEEECGLWGQDVESLHEQALENLVGRSGELTMEGNRAEGYTMLALSTADPYNAARILLPDLHRKLREHLGKTFYVAIPSREFLLVFNTEREDVLARVRKQITNDYKRMDHPVSPKLFQVTPDGIAGDPDEMEEEL